MRYRIIAIEREYASGGQEIGSKLAEKLGVPCYGREILELAAKEKRVKPEYLESIEEKATGSLLYSMHMLASMTAMAKGNALASNTLGSNTLSSEAELFLAESEIIRKLTQTPAVIVGRCAADSLKERKDVLRVFIRANEETRRCRAIEYYHIEPNQARAVLKRADRRRAAYYKANTGNSWSDSRNYHMVLDSGLLGIDICVNILEACCKGNENLKVTT